MIEWILTNWQLVLVGLYCLIMLIVTICKKPVKVVNWMTGLLKVLPSLINEAELTGLSGESKFTMVFSKCVSYLVSVTGLSAEQIVAKYSQNISDSIESCLSTPQKKGKENEKI